MIPVTKPFLPPKEDYELYLKEIWERNWLTNNGPLVNELEDNLKKTLNLENILFTSNGTIALQLAIKALNLHGEIITTPFSYVATTTAIIWENCIPVFADIDKDRLTIDPNKIEDLITDKTTGILATHVYGIPCHVVEIKQIADKHNLKVIYDAAHAFGSKYKGKSLLDYGDISTLSTHATKIFHTVEGGAVIAMEKSMNQKLIHLRNFGHDGPENYHGIGINGKNSEFHAAMGLINLKYIDDILEKRKSQYLYYIKELFNFKGEFIELPENLEYNYSYFPILFDSEDFLVKAVFLLEQNNIFCRRYFYPTLNSLDYIKKSQFTPIADDISKRILCLPVYHTLSNEEQDKIVNLILKSQIN